MYRVDLYHQWLPDRDMGRGLIQFFGPRAKRSYLAGEEIPAWEVVHENKKNTVSVDDSFKFSKK